MNAVRKVQSVAMILAAGIAGCSSKSDGRDGDLDGLSRELKSALERQPPAAGADSAAVTDLSEFALSFYAGLEKPDGNFVYSPYSIAVASAMLSVGAASDTLAQLQATLHFSAVGAPLHEAQNALSQLLAGRNREGGMNANAQTLRVSNDFWMLPTLEPRSGFLDVLAEYYGAGVQLCPFDSRPEDCRRDINAKVSTETSALIPELLPAGSIDSSVVFVLSNALYFKSRWQYEFAKSATAPGPFTTLSGASVQTDVMRRELPARYLEGDDFIAVELPYDGAELSMLLLVPAAGAFDDFMRSLTAPQLVQIAGALEPAQLDLSLPKFTVEGNVPLADELIAAGMVDAFDPDRADFSQIAPNIYIGGAFHQARLILDEEGTEAAAATAFVGVGTSAPPTPIRVVVDRPFAFLLRDATGAILFLGQLGTPG